MEIKIVKKIFKERLHIFLIILIVATFLIKILPLVIFPIPEFLPEADVVHHYKRIELIKQDFRYIGYEPYYPKGFHILIAALGNFISTGNAITLITIIFSFLFVFFSYKLAFAFSNDKTISLLTAFLSISISFISGVSGPPAPVPQTVGLTFTIMTLYFFYKQKFFIAGLLLGVHFITHFSWILSVILMFLYFLLNFNKKIFFSNIKYNYNFKKFLYFCLGFLPTPISYKLIAANFENEIVTPIEQAINYIPSFSGILAKFSDSMVSPLSFPAITNPPYILLLPVVALVLLRKTLSKNYLFLFIWFFSLIAASQSYWISELFFTFNALDFSIIFIGSRMFNYLIFPLAFFSSLILSELFKVNSAAKVITLVFLVSVFYLAIPDFNLTSSLGEEEFQAINQLKNSPIDSIVLTDNSKTLNTIVLMSLNVYPYQRDYFLMANGLNPIDTNHVDYILTKDENGYKTIDVLNKDASEFENIQHIYQTNSSLQNYIAPFFLKGGYGMDFILAESEFGPNIKIDSTDTNEEICFIGENFISTGVECNNLTEIEYYTLSGNKSDLIILFDSFQQDAFLNKFTHLYRNKKINLAPSTNVTFDGENFSLEEFSNVYKWVNFQSELSKPNKIIGKLLYKNLGK